MYINGFKLFLLKVGQKLPLSSGSWASPGGSDGKESTCNAGDPGSIPGLGGSPGEGNGNPHPCSCLKIPWTKEPGGLQSLGSKRVGHG